MSMMSVNVSHAAAIFVAVLASVSDVRTAPIQNVLTLGAGDVKLLGAIGAWLGPREVFWVAMYASLAGGVMALMVALATGYLGQAVANLRLLFTHWWVVGIRPLPELTL